MRTKTLFLAAAALAAGVASSMAQSNVYSVNLVGYVNVALGANAQTLLANPLDNGTNTIQSLDTGLPNKSSASIWTGSAFSSASKTAGAWSPNLSIPPGTGFFVKSPSAATLTFVGSAPTANTNVLAASAQVLIGSKIPFSGNLNDAGDGTLNLGPSLPNKSSVSTWTGTAYSSSSKTAGSFSPNLSIGVAQGFFVKPAAAASWNQKVQ